MGTHAENELQEKFMVNHAGNVRLIVIVLEPQQAEFCEIIVNHGRSAPRAGGQGPDLPLPGYNYS